jgi:S-adenosylmethionine hydrolase
VPTRVSLGGRALRLVGSYGELGKNEIGAVIGSFGTVEVFVREGSAARVLNAKRGWPLRVFA